jgi:hypothetical protein
MIQVQLDANHTMLMFIRMGVAVSPQMTRVFMGRHVYPYLADRARRRFRSEGDDASGRWAALAFNTGRIRRSKGFPAWHPINKRTGELESFATGSYRISGMENLTLTMPGNRGNARQQSKLRVAQKGGHVKSDRGARRMGPSRPAPARPVLAVGFRDSSELTLALLRWIQQGAAAPGTII